MALAASARIVKVAPAANVAIGADASPPAWRGTRADACFLFSSASCG
jgi:hypothetical protein